MEKSKEEMVDYICDNVAICKEATLMYCTEEQIREVYNSLLKFKEALYD